ncbi:MAG: hypothetical protein AAFX99_10580, partial [Myxococcota bacterium]
CAPLLSCTGANPRPDPTPAVGERPADDAVVQLMSHLAPIYPAVLTLWPDRIERSQAITTLARIAQPGVPADANPMEVLGSIIAPGVAQNLPPLEGLDRSRPILVGLYGVPESELFDLVIVGNIPDPLEAPTFLHNRFVVPAREPVTLAASLAQWGRLVGLQEAPTGGLTAIHPQSVAMAGPGLSVLMLPGTDHVRVDVAIQPIGGKIETPPGMVEMITRAPVAWDASTPARIHQLEGAGAAALYVDFDRFASAYMAYSTMEIAQGMAQFPPELQLKLLAQGTFNALTIGRMMHPRNRGVDDMTLSIEGTNVLDGRLTQSLTPSNRIAYEAALLRNRPRTEAQATQPVATLQVRRSWRELVRALPEPTWGGLWDSQDFMDNLELVGRIPLLYTLFAAPWRGLNFAVDEIKAMDPDLPVELPHHMTVVLETFTLSGSSASVVAGMVLDLPPGTPTEPYKRLAQHAETFLAQLGLKSPLQLQSVTESSNTRILVGIGKTPDQLFHERVGGPAPLEDFELHIHGATAEQLLSQANMPGLANIFGHLGTLSIVDRADGGCLATRIFATLDAPGDRVVPEPMVINDPRPAVVPEPMTEGEACLINVMHAFEEGLGLAADEDPDAIYTIFTTSEPHLAPLFACARKDPSTTAESRFVESGWYMLASRVSSWSNQEEQSRMWSQKACSLERQAGCRLAEQQQQQAP